MGVAMMILTKPDQGSTLDPSSNKRTRIPAVQDPGREGKDQ